MLILLLLKPLAFSSGYYPQRSVFFFLNHIACSAMCASYTSKQPLIVLSADAATIPSLVNDPFPQLHPDVWMLVDAEWQTSPHLNSSTPSAP
jgi:hypothetical protein